MANEELMRRVRRGYHWLKCNSEEMCAKNETKYDESRFLNNLKLYEKLVDEVVKLGITEEDCICFEANKLTTDDMTESEQLSVLLEGSNDGTTA